MQYVFLGWHPVLLRHIAAAVCHGVGVQALRTHTEEISELFAQSSSLDGKKVSEGEREKRERERRGRERERRGREREEGEKEKRRERGRGKEIFSICQTVSNTPPTYSKVRSL